MPYTILVIDDDAEVLQLVDDLLTSARHSVLTASNGADGLSIAQTIRPDLILLDYHMPGMDGLAVLERLKADETTRRTPVVALTSSTAEHANALSRVGAVAFIPKPFEPTEFLRLVDELLKMTAGKGRRPGSG
jgi:two-component system cell cycle response regulator DivK